MFKVSQKINLSENITRNNDFDLCNDYDITELKNIQILHLPNESVPINYDTQFVINKNGVKGNFNVKIENPNGVLSCTTPQVIDTQLLAVHFLPIQEGFHKIHIDCNSIPLPGSPFILNVIGSKVIIDDGIDLQLPVFQSDASKVICSGFETLNSNVRNEFIIDGSKAGNNILLIGVCGPNGHCDVVVKHLGNNIYNASFDINDSGEYLIAVKWGDDHIPGSPFYILNK